MQQKTEAIYLKKMISIILTIFFITFQSGCSVQKETDCSSNQNLSKTQVAEDRNQVIEYLESVHPFFVLEKEQEKYKAAKKTYIETTQRAMPITEFQEKTSIYLSSLDDGHTTLSWETGEKTPFLQIESIYENGRTYLYENGKKQTYT